MTCVSLRLDGLSSDGLSIGWMVGRTPFPFYPVRFLKCTLTSDEWFLDKWPVAIWFLRLNKTLGTVGRTDTRVGGCYVSNNGDLSYHKKVLLTHI